MLTDDGFHAWCLQNLIPAETKAYIERIRQSQPVRKVRSRASNVSGRYPSVKMGRSIQFESRHVELWGIYEMERDDDVLEYYDQPIRIQLQYRARSGRKTTQWHTPDFFVIRQNKAGFEEWKPVTALDQLSVTMPQRYQRETSGGWCCPPGESAAQVHGLFYRVRGSRSKWTKINVKLLRRNIVSLDSVGLSQLLDRLLLAPLVARREGKQSSTVLYSHPASW